jgi:hypothetical protein
MACRIYYTYIMHKTTMNTHNAFLGLQGGRRRGREWRRSRSGMNAGGGVKWRSLVHLISAKHIKIRIEEIQEPNPSYSFISGSVFIACYCRR